MEELPRSRGHRLALDMGCGNRKHAGAVGVDNVPLPSVDVIHDLSRFPYPFRDACADEVIFSHVLEHFTVEQIGAILRETYRILTPQGVVTISVPHALSVAFHSDPTHKTRFTFETLFYFTRDHAFSYYQEVEHRWRVRRIWASVNLFNNHFVELNECQLKIDRVASRALSYIVRHSKTWRLPDLIVKQGPFWLVNIHCQLSKVPTTLRSNAAYSN